MDAGCQINSPGHYKPYDAVKGTDTTDDNCASKLSKAVTSRQDDQGCNNSMFTVKHVHMTVGFSHCSKPWYVLSGEFAISPTHLARQRTPGCCLLCGNPLFASDCEMYSKLFVKLLPYFADPVELGYYSLKLNFHGVCSYCASTDRSTLQEYLQKYSTVLPICKKKTAKHRSQLFEECPKLVQSAHKFRRLIQMHHLAVVHSVWQWPSMFV